MKRLLALVGMLVIATGAFASQKPQMATRQEFEKLRADIAAMRRDVDEMKGRGEEIRVLRERFVRIGREISRLRGIEFGV